MKLKTHQKLSVILSGFAAFLFISCIITDSVEAKQIKIAVIDSGATDYADYYKSFSNFPANEDPRHHGTIVTKLIREAAPSAEIHMLQVCINRNGKLRPSEEAVYNAVKWSIENDIDIVNMSIVLNYDEKVEDIIKEASQKHGIVFVAASGNNAMKSRFAMDSDGFIKKGNSNAEAFPSSINEVISVGGLDENGEIARYSAKKSDVYDDGNVGAVEGSSFACARVTGKLATQDRIFDGGLAKQTILKDYPVTVK